MIHNMKKYEENKSTNQLISSYFAWSLIVSHSYSQLEAAKSRNNWVYICKQNVNILKIIMKSLHMLHLWSKFLLIIIIQWKTLKNWKKNDTQLVWRWKIDINLPSNEYFPKSIKTKPKNDQGKSYNDRTKRQRDRHWELQGLAQWLTHHKYRDV